LLSECVRERSLAVDVKVCAVSVRMWMIQGLNDGFFVDVETQHSIKEL